MKGPVHWYVEYELRDQIVAIIDSPEFQQWKLKRQNEEPCHYLGLDDVEEL